MEIKQISKNASTSVKKNFVPIMIIGGLIGGLIAFLGRNTSANSTTTTADLNSTPTVQDDTSGIMQAQTDQMSSAVAENIASLSAGYQQSMQQMYSQFQTDQTQKLTDLQNQYNQKITDSYTQLQNQNTAQLDELSKNWQASQDSLKNEVDKYLNNQTTPTTSTTPVESNSPITIYAGGADYALAKQGYGNISDINIVDVGHMNKDQLNAINFKSGDIVLGGVMANSNEGHGVNRTNIGNATRIAGQDRYSTFAQLQQHLSN